MTDAVPAAAQRTPGRTVTMESLAIPVTRAENRAASFTNQRSAYFYTQTHRNDHPEHAWFRGLNLAGRRVFNDYQLVVGGAALDPATASVVVRPDALIRTYPNGIVEALRLFDGQDVVEIELAHAPAGVELRLSGDQLRPDGGADGLTRYVSTSGAGAEAKVDHVVTGWRSGRFLVAVDSSREAAAALFEQAVRNAGRWRAERRARLEGLLSGDRYFSTDDPELTRALRWITLTTDQLVTRQRGDGIYAGLPWFNEYWGRDEFISLPGAVLVTGHFEEARAILRSFARFQQLDRGSEFYGRLPNIVKPGSIDYHTTDGTPRWVIALRDYVDASGDRSIVRELYPNVAASIEGALARWTDADGYLVHADNETWMDARREPDHASYSPRASRANDIQALWYQQLHAGAAFAAEVGDTARAARWSAAAERVRAHFARDFVDPATGRIADRLPAGAPADFTLRPNLLFALELVDDPAVAARATRRAWEALVYPWGVATLDRADPFFHPYHLAWEHYHKDEAYHNGTVWPWLNGIAMQRMIERGQTEPAWRLFQEMNATALHRGGVGGLPETMDAFPHPGENRPRLTGTFLQAWSNAEQLRVWHQRFLGIQPRLSSGVVVLAPRLPAALNSVDLTARVGAGSLRGVYGRVAGGRRYTWRLGGASTGLTVDLAPYPPRTFAAAAGDVLIAEERGGRLRLRLLSAAGTVKESATLAPSAERLAEQARLDAILRGTPFAAPGRAEDHRVMRQVYHRDGG
ncbi:MAG TPA: amylo-alpha-1,6-glucosidase [Longimicrobium sp.]|nr:amylo-alpha-1,6-glucosidase [Longimicrobium sp.]